MRNNNFFFFFFPQAAILGYTYHNSNVKQQRVRQLDLRLGFLGVNQLHATGFCPMKRFELVESNYTFLPRPSMDIGEQNLLQHVQ